MMKIILKSILVIKSAVFVTSHIQDIISKYRIKARQLLFPLSRLFPELPFEITYAQSVLKKIELGCLAYGIVQLKTE